MRVHEQEKTMNEWQHQMMLERLQQLQEALQRAEHNQATEDDWKVIYSECGLRRENELNRVRT
jgi:hypothetical protein